MSIGIFGICMLAKIPLFPRKAIQENVKIYAGIKNGKKSENLKKFLCEMLVQSIRIDNVVPITAVNKETANPMNRVLMKMDNILGSYDILT